MGLIEDLRTGHAAHNRGTPATYRARILVSRRSTDVHAVSQLFRVGSDGSLRGKRLAWRMCPSASCWSTMPA
jgi:hypothetical protein